MRSPAFLTKVLCVLAVISLALVAYSMWDESHQPWADCQREFIRLAAAKTFDPDKKAHARRTPVEIRQIHVPALGMVDRCVSCHQGIEDPRFAEDTQPFTAHPGDLLEHHPPQRFGCTLCHHGQGRATILPDAHGNVPHWDAPLLVGDLIESACGTCHLGDDVPEAPYLTAGRKTLRTIGCLGCHKIRGYDGHVQIGPELSGLGNKVKPGWVPTWLKDPTRLSARAKMPSYRLTDDEIGALTAYLMTLRLKDAPVPKVLTAEEQEAREEEWLDLSERGGTRFRESRCITCHTVEGKGGTKGPELTAIANKVNYEWLLDWLADPKKYNPETPMPRYHADEADLKAIAAYLMTEMIGDEEEEEEEEDEQAETAPASSQPRLSEAPVARSRRKKQIADGRQAFLDYGCHGCHAVRDLPPQPQIGPELTAIGRKHVHQLEFGGVTDLRRTTPDWLFAKLKDPGGFDRGTDKPPHDRAKMPDFRLADLDAKDLVIALMSLTDRPMLEQYVVAAPPPSDFDPQGPLGVLFKRYSCLSCHRVRGRGDTLAPDLSFEGSQVHYDWLVQYLKVPYAIRSGFVLPERMPRLNLTDQEAALFADYAKLALRSDAIPDDFQVSPEPETVAAGQQLFHKKYACQACHIVGEEGGFVGPSLAEVADRLKPGWVYAWLTDPHAFRPESLEPDAGVTDQEARQIAAYLTTLTAKGRSATTAPKPQPPRR